MLLPYAGSAAYSPLPDLDSAKLLATALVSSHLDYCNSLLYGVVLGMTLNCTRWLKFGSSSLRKKQFLLVAITPRSTLARSGNTC